MGRLNRQVLKSDCELFSWASFHVELGLVCVKWLHYEYPSHCASDVVLGRDIFTLCYTSAR